MGLLTKDQLLKADELQMKKVHLDGEDFVYVREMTAREKDRFEQSLMTEVQNEDGTIEYKSNPEDYKAKLLSNTICDEQGNLLLDPDDIPTLSQNKGASKLEKLANVANSLNRISKKDREEMTKNSNADNPDGSTSDSAKS